MPTEPDQRAPIAVGLEAMGHLRAANLRLADAYRYAADDIGENYIQGENSRRNNRHLPGLAQAWNEAEAEFRRACMIVAPTIDASLRLADVESIGERFANLSMRSTDNPVSITEISTFDQHIHELFEELQRRWPELEQQPPLAKFDDDDMALRPDWRLGLERHPLRVISALALILYVIGFIVWQIVTRT